jgi:hypothetical protein
MQGTNTDPKRADDHHDDVVARIGSDGRGYRLVGKLQGGIMWYDSRLKSGSWEGRVGV